MCEMRGLEVMALLYGLKSNVEQIMASHKWKLTLLRRAHRFLIADPKRGRKLVRAHHLLHKSTLCFVLFLI